MGPHSLVTIVTSGFYVRLTSRWHGRAMQIGQGGSLPASTGSVSGARSETPVQKPDTPRANASDAARAAQKRVIGVAADAEPAATSPRRILPRGTLVNITV